MAHSRSFLANQKARNAIVGAENLLSNVSVQFQKKIRKISLRRSRSPKYAELVYFTSLFCKVFRKFC